MSSQRMARVQDPIIPHIAALIRDNPGTISLGQGVVNYPPPPGAEKKLEGFWSDARRHLYAPVDGIPSLKERISLKLAADNGIRLNEELCLFVTAGANMAFLNALFAITESGDEIILFAPYYFNHDMAIAMLDCKTIAVEVDEDYQVNLDRLAQAMNKMYFQLFPEEVRPRTLITRDRDEIKAFARELGGKIVIKRANRAMVC